MTENKISFAGAGMRLARWFREMRSELRKVVWPSRKQLMNNMLVSITVMIAMGILTGALDQIALFIVRQIINLGTLF